MNKGTLASQFETEQSEAATVLDRARKCAELSKPWLLPEKGHNEHGEFKNNYQSVGSNGLTVFVGKLMDMVFPAGRPFFQLDLAPQIRYAPDADEAVNRERIQQLALREMTMMGVLESANLDRKARRSRRAGFRSKKYQALLQCVGTGDVLEQLTDDYRLKVFRRDHWIARRDSIGDVLHFIVKENVDIFGVQTKTKDNAAVRSEVGLDKIEEDDYKHRMQQMYTRCKYQHESKTWMIEQEINGSVFNESEEPVPPFFSTPYELVSPEHYGRGLIENNLGDLSGLDDLEMRLLDLMAMAAKFHPVVDPASEITPRDLEQPTGTVLVGRVAGGQAADVGMLSAPMSREFTVLEAGISRKEKMLGRAMLTEIESQPEGERVTAYQVARVAREIELATGGITSSVADDQQMPLLVRLEYQMERDKLLKPLPKEGYDIVSITGINALRQGERGQAALNLAQIAAQMPPEAQRRIDWSVLIDVIVRYQYINEPGLIKSREQVEQELAQARQQAIAQQAAEKGVEVLGNAAEQNLTQQQGQA